MTGTIKISTGIIICILLGLADTGCDVTRQAKQVSALSKCDFRIFSVEQVDLAGIRFDQIRSVSDMNLGDVARIMGALASPVLPLSMRVNVEVHNPNNRDAGLNRLEWVLFIDDNQMTTGILDQPFSIPANSTQLVPVEVGIDLKQALKGKPGEALLNFCMNLAGAGSKPTRFKIKLKPRLTVAGVEIIYPGFITVNTEYASPAVTPR